MTGRVEPAVPTADLVVRGGPVHTVDGDDRVVEAVAVRDGRILATGDARAIAGHVGRDTRVVELGGRSLVPGFVDNHIHLANATQRAWLDVTHPGVRSIANVVERVAAHASGSVTPGAWILGRGVDPARLAERRMPTRHDLDAATTAHPVGIANREGMGWTFNTAGLRAIGVTDTTPDPPGGPLLRDERGRPLGPMWDNARTVFVNPNLPAPTLEEQVAACAALAADLNRAGVTTALEAAYRRPIDAAAWRLLRAAAPPTLRVVLEPYPVHGDAWDEGGTASAVVGSGLGGGFGGAWLRLGAVQMGVDGGILGRTAALGEPYAGGGPDDRGSFRASLETLRGAVARCEAAGWQVGLVCHGDAGIARALDAIAGGLPGGLARARRSHQASRPPGPQHARRPRLEHAYLWTPALMDRAAELGVVWNTQPAMLRVAGPGATIEAWGDRARYAFPFRSLHQRGVTISSGSDWGVGPMAPLAALATLATHRFAAADRGAALNPDEALTVPQALRVLTTGSARAGFLEGELGAIVPGLRADLVVLDRDLRTVDPRDLDAVAVDETWVDGRRVWSREAAGDRSR